MPVGNGHFFLYLHGQVRKASGTSAGLKSAAAQERNVRKALHVLAGGKARFMAREWNSCVT
jgi:hypothetical protein